MSVELRMRVQGDCQCGQVHSAGFEPSCAHWLECDWGVITNGEANPCRGLQPLMLATYDYVETLVQDGPKENRHGGIDSATIEIDENNDVRWFAHLDYDSHRTTWELFDAHFSDDCDADVVFLVGRWPD